MTAPPPAAAVIESTPGHTPNLNAALVAARLEFGPLHKNAVNTFFKKQDGTPHRFADLSAILDLIEDTLLKHGLLVMQHPGGTATMAEVTTELRHVSGEMTSSTARCPATKQDPQGYGAAFTYLRRFALEGIMGLRAEDDDGNSHAQHKKPKPEASKPSELPKPTEADIKVLVDSFAALGVTVAELDKRLGWPVATMSAGDMVGLRKFYAEKRAAAKNPDAAAQEAVKQQAETAMAAFARFVDRIKAAGSEKEVTLIQAEASALKWTKGDAAALARAVTDRVFLLKEAAKPATQSSGDVPF